MEDIQIPESDPTLNHNLVTPDEKMIISENGKEEEKVAFFLNIIQEVKVE